MLQCIIYGKTRDMCKHFFAVQQCYSAYVITAASGEAAARL
jgi:hypothetical protein